MTDILKKHARLNGWLWRIVCVVVGTVFGAGTTFGVMRTQIKDLEECTDDHEERLRTVEKVIPRADEKLNGIDANVKALRDDIKDLRKERR